jgi:lipoprotein-releasing system ATP-binding protein
MKQPSISTDTVSVLRATNVWKSYDDGAIPVLCGVDLEVRTGESVALCGPSGCGKSTLLHLFGGLDLPDNGEIFLDGAALTAKTNLLPILRHRVGFVFQMHNLIPDLTLRENCLIPAVAAGTERKKALRRLDELAAVTGISHRLDHRIQKLSGGERQRTAICRALMNRPGILLADEPTGSLDEKNAEDIFRLLIDLTSSERVTMLMATHDRALAERCNRTIEMRNGRINAAF